MPRLSKPIEIACPICGAPLLVHIKAVYGDSVNPVAVDIDTDKADATWCEHLMETS